MNKPQFVTFTGLDRKTDLRRCKELSNKYPIEWGVLYGSSDSNRYPVNNGQDILDLINAADISRSAHLCGKYARAAMNDIDQLCGVVDRFAYNRYQINAVKYDQNSLDNFAEYGYSPVIMQTRSKTFPTTSERVQCLFDCSGGRGKEIDQFPVQKEPKLVGYAGGINPDNVLDIVTKINKVASYYWIDMESGVRTNDWLDLDKCEKVCKQIWG